MTIELRDAIAIVAIAIQVLIVPFLRGTIDLAIARALERVAERFAAKESVEKLERDLREEIGVRRAVDGVASDVRLLLKRPTDSLREVPRV